MFVVWLFTIKGVSNVLKTVKEAFFLIQEGESVCSTTEIQWIIMFKSHRNQNLHYLTLLVFQKTPEAQNVALHKPGDK